MRCPALACCLVQVVLGLAAHVALQEACSANEFCLIDDDQLAVALRAELIRSAQCEISVAYYAIDSGEVPLGLLALLREAAQRGVVVRVLVDGLQSRLPSGLELMLVRGGIQIRKYHPPHKGHPAWLNRRMHTKLLVVDRQAMIIGSRNLQDHHFGRECTNYVDSDVYLSGEICVNAAAYFEWLWHEKGVYPARRSNPFGLDLVQNLKLDVSPISLRCCQREAEYQRALACGLASINRIVCHSYDSRFEETPCLSGVNACLLHDGFAPKTQRSLQECIVNLLDHARVSIHLETAYPVFSRPVFAAFRRAACRGVTISMLTNSLESADYVSTYAAYQNQKAELLRMGVKLYEICGRDHLHVKTMIIDRQLTMVGSYNFDVRSDRLNLELNVVLQDPRVAQLVMQASQKRICRSQRISSQACCPEVGGEPPLLKQVRMRASQAVVPLYRRSL